MNNFEIRALPCYYWKKCLSIRADAEICKVEGEGTNGKTAAIKWFKRFGDGDFNFSETSPILPDHLFWDEEDLRAALEDEPSSNIRDLTDELGVAQRTVVNYLHKFDSVH